jgi:hypothetical protein
MLAGAAARPDAGAGYAVRISPAAIAISDHGVVSKAITLLDIAPFDNDFDGKPSKPLKDYRFSAQYALDGARGLLYFSVYNSATTGNANASRGLFRYDLRKPALDLLIEEFGVGFAILEPSSDGSYLVFSDGGHGGLCYDRLGLGIYDLKNKQRAGSIFLPEGAVGSVHFDHWIDARRFAYKEETYPTLEDCRRHYGHPRVVQKIKFLGGAP